MEPETDEVGKAAFELIDNGLFGISKFDAVSLGDGRWKCPCGYIYGPAKGDPKHGIPAGTKFEDLPDNWRCPRCKRKKEKFEAL